MHKRTFYVIVAVVLLLGALALLVRAFDDGDVVNGEPLVDESPAEVPDEAPKALVDESPAETPKTEVPPAAPVTIPPALTDDLVADAPSAPSDEQPKVNSDLVSVVAVPEEFNFTEDWELDPEPYRIALSEAATGRTVPTTWTYPMDIVLDPGESFVSYFGNVDINHENEVILDVKYSGTSTQPGGENLVSLTNSSNGPVTYTLDNGPSTGWGFLGFYKGPINIPFAARFPILRPSHCGLTLGCPWSDLYTANWTGTGHITSMVHYDTPLVVDDNVPLGLNANWQDLSPVAAYAQELLRLKTIRDDEFDKTPQDVGVTFINPWVFFSTTGFNVYNSDGEVLLTIPSVANTIDVVMLFNTNYDTQVYSVGGFSEVTAYEYNNGELLPNGELLARAQLGPDGLYCKSCTTARVWMITRTSVGVEEIFEVSESILYTEPLPE